MKRFVAFDLIFLSLWIVVRCEFTNLLFLVVLCKKLEFIIQYQIELDNAAEFFKNFLELPNDEV